MESKKLSSNQNTPANSQFKLQKNYSKKIIEDNLEKLPTFIKDKLEKALKLKKTKPLVINEEYYKTKEQWAGKQKHKNFVYELIPSDNYEKNNKKTFSVNPEINLIDKFEIEEILKDGKIPIQEKVKNFDIQYETNIDEYRTLKMENTNFHTQFHKFYNNGDLVEFEPFKKNNDKKNSIQKVLEKQIFDEIIHAYEKKNYKIPDFIKKNLFEVSPLLVDLNKIKEFYNVAQRLEEPTFLRDIKKMIKISSSLNSEEFSNIKDVIDYSENDFVLNKSIKGQDLKEMKKKNFDSYKTNKKMREYIDQKAEELKTILSNNEFLNPIIEECKDEKENFDPNNTNKSKSLSHGDLISHLRKGKEENKKKLNFNEILINTRIHDEESLENNMKNHKNVNVKKKSHNKNEYQKNNRDLFMKMEQQKISPIKKTLYENENKKEQDTFENIHNNENKEMKKKEKCFKTQGSVKKKMNKNKINVSSFQLNNMTIDNKNNLVLYKKTKILNEKIDNHRLNHQIKHENKETKEDDNLFKIQNFKIFDNMKFDFDFIKKRNKDNEDKILNEKNVIRNSFNNVINISLKEKLPEIKKTEINNKNNSFLLKNGSFLNSSIYYKTNDKEKDELKMFDLQNDDIKNALKNLENNKIENIYETQSNNNENINHISKKNLIDISNFQSIAEGNTNNMISSSKIKTMADSNSLSINRQFSISNNKTNNVNSFNNVSVSDFISKFSTENVGFANATINIQKIQNNSNIENSNINLIMQLNNTNYMTNEKSINNHNVIIPKGFKKTDNQTNKKLMPIKLKNFNELKKLEINSTVKNFNDSKMQKNSTIYPSTEKNQKDSVQSTFHFKNTTNNLGEKINNQEILLTDEERLKNIVDENQKILINTQVDNEQSNKEIHLEKLYNKIANRNFHNLKNELIEYLEMFSDRDISTELSALHNKCVEPKNILKRINTLKTKVKSKDFDYEIANICADNGILNINPDGINKIKKLDKLIMMMDYDLVKKIV